MDTLPSTVEEAVDHLLARMDAEGQATIRATPQSELIRFHLPWGMWVRHELGLWGGNPQLISSIQERSGSMVILHPDDASMIVIQALWERLQRRA